MGSRGVIPKRQAERRRRNLEGRADIVRRDGAVRVPPAPQDLHPIARRWYRSLSSSGQSGFFEPSDWAAALYVAEAMTRNLNAPRFSGPMFTAVWDALESLLTTEQARRRSRLEVQRAVNDEAEKRPGVTAIDEYRRSLAT